MLSRLPEGVALELERKGGNRKALRLERVRDVAFEAALPQRERLIFRVILGTENQSYVDYGMVIREMGYEAGSYGEQLKIRKIKNRQEKRLKKRDEFLSGIRKGERLVPIVNFVFYYGESAWDGSTRLFELLDIPREEAWIYDYISDYKINLVHAGNVVPEHFRTGLRQVFELLPYSGNGREMERYVEQNSQEFANVSEEAFDLLATFFDGGKLELAAKKEQLKNEEGGGYNMCTAFREIREDGIKIGKDQGIKLGRDQGIKLGRDQGIKLGRDQGIKIGKDQGIKLGEERVNQLIQCLIRDCRMEEIERAVSDKAYQQELFSKYGI